MLSSSLRFLESAARQANGRIFYPSQASPVEYADLLHGASGLIVSQTYGPESPTLPAVWERP